MSSWNHTLRPFTPEELAYWEEREQAQKEQWGEPGAKSYRADDSVHWNECSAPRCHGRPVFHSTYDYITGRKGRVSYARKELCVDHARKFAAKNGLPFDESALPMLEPAPSATQAKACRPAQDAHGCVDAASPGYVTGDGCR